MTKKPESSKGQKKGEQKPHSQGQDVHESADFEYSAIDSMLSTGESDPEKLASLLDKADASTKERLVGRLGQKHGNRFVQRMLVQRQPVADHAREQTGEESTARHSPEEWAAFSDAAMTGAKVGFTNFQAAAHMTGVIINSVVANGGRLIGPPIGPQVMTQVLGAGASPQVAVAFGNAANSAWLRWVSSVSIPGLPLYPSFAAVPAPMAPPTPNVPQPLIAIGSGRMIDSGSVTSSIIGAIGDLADEPGAREAASSFGTSLQLSFLTWLLSRQLRNLLGKGPVPSFAPPYVPVGPVIMGDVIPAPGIIF